MINNYMYRYIVNCGIDIMLISVLRNLFLHREIILKYTHDSYYLIMIMITCGIFGFFCICLCVSACVCVSARACINNVFTTTVEFYLFRCFWHCLSLARHYSDLHF